MAPGGFEINLIQGSRIDPQKDGIICLYTFSERVHLGEGKWTIFGENLNTKQGGKSLMM